jgi:hypothetical protein
MILHGNPNDWSCLPTAFAMVLGMDPAAFIKQIGHDGGDEPYQEAGLKMGFHQQECIEVAQRLGFACTPIEIGPTISPHLDGHDARKVYFIGGLEGNWERLHRHMQEEDGVLTGMYMTAAKTLGHAVAWDHTTKTIYDPNFNGQVYDFDAAPVFGFTPGCFWKVQNVLHG